MNPTNAHTSNHFACSHTRVSVTFDTSWESFSNGQDILNIWGLYIDPKLDLK